jgi:hypothetical protein
MKNTLLGAGLVCAMLGLFPVASAQADGTLNVTTPAATTPAPTTVATATPDPLDKVVCRMQPPPLGTRIGRMAICQTQREWNTLENGAKARFHDIQMKNNYGNPDNNGSD